MELRPSKLRADVFDVFDHFVLQGFVAPAEDGRWFATRWPGLHHRELTADTREAAAAALIELVRSTPTT
jgi:hypothetical protein